MDEMFPDHIVVRDRIRPLDVSNVDVLAASIKEIGLQNPVHVFVDGDDTVLVAGRHRLAAVQQLGHEWIDVIYVDLDDLDRQLWEIDENLMRAELTELQRAGHLKRRKEIFDLKNLGGRNAPTKKPQHQKAFASETATATGMGKRRINESIARAEKIPEDIQERILGTDIEDSGVELDAIAKLDHDEQIQVMDRVEMSGESAREAVEFITGVDPVEAASEKRRAAAWKAFVKLTESDRALFFAKLKEAGWL